MGPEDTFVIKYLPNGQPILMIRKYDPVLSALAASETDPQRKSELMRLAYTESVAPQYLQEAMFGDSGGGGGGGTVIGVSPFEAEATRAKLQTGYLGDLLQSAVPYLSTGEYFPGFEPQGPMAYLYQVLGAPFSGVKPVDVTVPKTAPSISGSPYVVVGGGSGGGGGTYSGGGNAGVDALSQYVNKAGQALSWLRSVLGGAK